MSELYQYDFFQGIASAVSQHTGPMSYYKICTTIAGWQGLLGQIELALVLKTAKTTKISSWLLHYSFGCCMFFV